MTSWAGWKSKSSTFDAKIAALKRSHDALEEEVARFTLGRIKQLEARTAGLASNVAVAQAKREVAQSAAIRAVELSHTNTVSAAELERLQRDETIATQTAVGAERELDAANVELEAARSGSFIGDSYNDMPSSAQRRDELRERLDELAADRDAAIAQIARLRAASVTRESTHYQALSDVVVSLPVSGRIWEVMTAPGEHVQVGQDLLKILDCSGAVVTANVTEAVYNRLRVGAPARFRPTDGGADLAGRRHEPDRPRRCAGKPRHRAIGAEPRGLSGHRAACRNSPPSRQLRHRAHRPRHLRQGARRRPNELRSCLRRWRPAFSRSASSAVAGAVALAAIETPRGCFMAGVTLALMLRYFIWRATSTLPEAGLTLRLRARR